MADWRVVVGNGPCKGQTYTKGFIEQVEETFTCNGAQYFTTEVADGQFLALTEGTPKPVEYQPEPEPEPEPIKLDGGLADAWNELRRTLGHRIPAAVNDTARLRRRIQAAGRR